MVKINDVWDRTTEFLSEHLRLVLPIAILAILIPTSISNSLGELRAFGPQGARIGLGVLALAVGLLSLWAQLAITSLVIDGVGARRATQRLLPAIGIYALLALAAVAAAAIAAIPLALASGPGSALATLSGGDPQRLAAAMTPAAALAAFAVILVMLILLVRLATLLGVIVAERRGAGAIRRAIQLTRGLSSKLVGVAILYVIVATVSQWAAQAVFGSVLRLIAGGEGPVTLAGVLTGAIVAAVQTAFTVLVAVFAAKLYLACLAAEKARVAPAPLSTPS
jgi:hypothetical protein